MQRSTRFAPLAAAFVLVAVTASGKPGPTAKVCGLLPMPELHAQAQDLGDEPLPTTACFLLDGGYRAISIGSDAPKATSYETVKGLLEKAAARRK